MALITGSFDKNTEAQSTKTDYKKLFEDLEKFLTDLLAADSYIPVSAYNNSLEQYSEKIEFLKQVIEENLFKEFCDKKNIDFGKANEIINKFTAIKDHVGQHNKEFLESKMKSEKEYLDNILTEIDPAIKLDKDQRKVVLTDEDYCLVIAGAGAGKTTTVAAKVKYLVEKQNIQPEDILVVSFTNKAVKELQDKIQQQLHIDCKITTFHATGNAILNLPDDGKSNIVSNDKLYFVLEDYFNKSVLTNDKMVDDLVMFFASYCDASAEDIKDEVIRFNKIASSTYTTLKSDLGEFEERKIPAGDNKYLTIQEEQVNSYEEVKIANFLYLNNIEYKYEPTYNFYIPGSLKLYTPDFIIRQGDKEVYLEHFGITEDFKSNRYTPEELKKYVKEMNDKIEFHKKHETQLIYTFSRYNDGRELIEHLQEILEENKFVLKPKDNKEVMKKISAHAGSRYVKKLIVIIKRFIENFKTNGHAVQQFDEWMSSETNVRSKLFLSICKECYLEYERYLNSHKSIDFSDMINKSALLLQESEIVRNSIKYKYIIVDEYQDISKQRFNLVEALHKTTDAKIIAVGDDWQSIYAFSGSNIKLFTDFSQIMGYAELLPITNTYRNSQEVIDIAGKFILQNESQYRKILKSPKTITDPVIIYTYVSKLKEKGDPERSGAIFNQAKAVQVAIEQILEYDKQEGKKNSSILLLGRYAFDGKNLERSGLFKCDEKGNGIICLKYPELDLTFMTAHASKGLGYDNVIVINGKNEMYGFPSKIEDDPVLNYVIKRDNSIEAAEERRLFYVAMTRTKNRVYFVAPEENPSEFLLEIKHDNKTVVLKGEWNEELSEQNRNKKICPICGYPLQYRAKEAYGLKLWICTNEPEICDFMTNDPGAGKLSVLKCPDCEGFLIVRSKNTYFLGCTNYKSNKKGCNKTINKQEFYKMMGYAD